MSAQGPSRKLEGGNGRGPCDIAGDETSGPPRLARRRVAIEAVVMSGNRSALRWMDGVNLRRTGLFAGASRAQGSRVRLGRAWERPGPACEGPGSRKAPPCGGPDRRLEAESPSDSPKADGE